MSALPWLKYTGSGAGSDEPSGGGALGGGRVGSAVGWKLSPGTGGRLAGLGCRLCGRPPTVQAAAAAAAVRTTAAARIHRPGSITHPTIAACGYIPMGALLSYQALLAQTGSVVAWVATGPQYPPFGQNPFGARIQRLLEMRPPAILNLASYQ